MSPSEVEPGNQAQPPRPGVAAHLNRALLSWFGCGHAPVAPGTIGSLGALPFAWIIMDGGGRGALLLAAAAIFLLGWTAAAVHLRGGGETEDPQWIVVDEVAGQWIALLAFTGPPAWWQLALGFALFRFFDIAKPWPVSWADRRVAGALGIMLDDVLAGLYACICLWALNSLTAPPL